MLNIVVGNPGSAVKRIEYRNYSCTWTSGIYQSNWGGTTVFTLHISSSTCIFACRGLFYFL